MSALALEIRPSCRRRVLPHGLQLAVAAVAGALAPWLLLVTAYGGLARSAASCLGSPLPI